MVERRSAEARHAWHQALAAARIAGDQVVDDLPGEDYAVGLQLPSPAKAGRANGVSGAGTGRCAEESRRRPVALTLVCCCVGRASAKGRPPTGGWWWGDHQFSAVFTTEPAPLSRNHSAKRAGTESPSAGLVSAPPREAHTGVRSTNRVTVPVVRG